MKSQLATLPAPTVVRIANAPNDGSTILERSPRGIPIARAWPDKLDAWTEAVAFEEAILAGRADDAHRIVRGCLDDRRGLVEVEQHVIAPSLYRIGDKWQTDSITVAQEHMATAIAQSVMIVALTRSPVSPAIGRRVLLACIEGNTHALGLQMVADAFQLAGWDIDYLGADVPSLGLVRHVSDSKPNLVAISVSFARQLREVKDVISRLTECLGSARPPVLVGGRPINRFPNLARSVGGDAFCANSAAAVAYATG